LVNYKKKKKKKTDMATSRVPDLHEHSRCSASSLQEVNNSLKFDKTPINLKWPYIPALQKKIPQNDILPNTKRSL
jgi:hypothetical protein